METTKICSVCGDKAIARNFCVLTCESCKAFFRRNASKIDKIECIYGNNCTIDLDTRKRCRKCRLKKCFKVGMKKEWILNEEEKEIRNNKIKENREKRHQNNGNNDLIVKTFNSNSSNESNDSDISKQRLSVQQTTDTSNNENHNSSQILVPIIRPLNDYNNNFTETEGNVFTELLNATKYLTILFPNITSETNCILEAMRIMGEVWDGEVRKMIRTAKFMTAFKNICKDDQVTLLKYGVIEIALLRSIIYYDLPNETWRVPLDENNSTKLDLQVFKQHSIVNYERGKVYMSKLAQIWDMDQIHLHLMTAILLFDPNRPHLTHRQQIRFKQQIYKHLFKRYLLLKYRSESESEFRFSRIMQIIDNTHEFHEIQMRYFLERKPQNYPFFSASPLMKELYNKTDNYLQQNSGFDFINFNDFDFMFENN